MAAFDNEIYLLCAGRAAPAWCPPGLAAALQGTDCQPHTSHGTPLPRTLTAGWLSLSYRVNGFASLAAGYQLRRWSSFFSPSWVKNAPPRADSPTSHQWQWTLVTISTAPPPSQAAVLEPALKPHFSRPKLPLPSCLQPGAELHCRFLTLMRAGNWSATRCSQWSSLLQSSSFPIHFYDFSYSYNAFF